jgi:chromosome segregation ATPase
VNPGGQTAEAKGRPAVHHLTLPNPDDEVLRLTRELAAVRAKLESAEFALAHLGSGDKPLEARLQSLVQEAVADAQAVRNEGRKQIETLVAEAEQLRTFARQGAESSAKQAREEVMRKAGEMLENANRLRLAAEETASQVVRAAQAKYEEAQVRATDLLRSTELAHAETMRKRAEIEQQVVAARAQAQAFLRTSRLEAEARARELTDLARQQLAEAQRQAEAIVRAAEQEARIRLRDSNGPPPAGEAQFRREEALAPGVAPTEEVRVNRVDRGRKFGRPQT